MGTWNSKIAPRGKDEWTRVLGFLDGAMRVASLSSATAPPSRKGPRSSAAWSRGRSGSTKSILLHIVRKARGRMDFELGVRAIRLNTATPSNGSSRSCATAVCVICSWAASSSSWLEQVFRDLRSAAASYGIAIRSVFTAHRELGGFFAGDPGMERAARRNYERLIEVAALLGASYAGSNPGAVLRDRMSTKEAGIRCYLKHMKELMAGAKALGLAGLTIEPMSCGAEPPSYPGRSKGCWPSSGSITGGRALPPSPPISAATSPTAWPTAIGMSSMATSSYSSSAFRTCANSISRIPTRPIPRPSASARKKGAAASSTSTPPRRDRVSAPRRLAGAVGRGLPRDRRTQAGPRLLRLPARPAAVGFACRRPIGDGGPIRQQSALPLPRPG